jgi:CBS-domain-containing membrane protein
MLVTDKRNRTVGLIGLADLMRGLQPPCMRLTDDRSMETDSIYLEPSDYLGNFATMVRAMAAKKIRELMPDKAPTIEADADLLEATNRLLSLRIQSLLVMEGDTAVGVIRDNDIFAEMTHVMREPQVDDRTH